MISPPVPEIDCGSIKRYVEVTIDSEVLTTVPNLGFNVRHSKFEDDFWTTEVDATTLAYLNNFTDFTYRYPGGLPSNDFIWDDPHGFGVQQYLDFLGDVSGKFLYVLNLTEPSADSAALATFIAANYAGERYYQLGNELDRSTYEWTHQEYIDTSLAHINAILAVDSSAKFIAFLRQFKWVYDDSVSLFADFIKDVLSGLTMVNDFSLHCYVDGYQKEGGSYGDVPTSVIQIENAIAIANNVRPCDCWITEHSARLDWDKENLTEYQKTSNIIGCLSTADTLISLVQVPEVKHLCWQALNGINRQVFDSDMSLGDLSPRPIYWMFRVLKEELNSNVLTTSLCSTTEDYVQDLNFVAFGGLPNINMWITNRRPYPVRVKLKNTFSTVKHYFLKGDKEDYAYNLTNSARLVGDEIIVPPYSVNNYIFT